MKLYRRAIQILEKMFGSTNEGQKLQIKKNEQQGIMETKLPNQEIATF